MAPAPGIPFCEQPYEGSSEILVLEKKERSCQLTFQWVA